MLTICTHTTLVVTEPRLNKVSLNKDSHMIFASGRALEPAALWSSPPKPATCFPQHLDALAVQQTMLLLQPNQAAHLLASGMSLTHAFYQHM